MKINNKLYCVRGSDEFRKFKDSPHFKSYFEGIHDNCDGDIGGFFYFISSQKELTFDTIRPMYYTLITIKELKQMMSNKKIIGYTYPEAFYMGDIPANELWISFGENGSWYYPKCDEYIITNGKRGIPKEIVEKYFSPVYEEEKLPLPKIGKYEGEIFEINPKCPGVKYGCKKYSIKRVEDIISFLEKNEFNSIKIEGNEVNLETIKKIYKILQQYVK